MQCVVSQCVETAEAHKALRPRPGEGLGARVAQLRQRVAELKSAAAVKAAETETLRSELERFALCKLARPGHDHHNLDAAFSEVLP